MGYFDDIQFIAGDIIPRCTAVVDQRFEGMYSIELMLSGRLSLAMDQELGVIVTEPVIFWHHPSHRYRYGAVDPAGWHHHYITCRGERARRILEDGLMPLASSGFLPVADGEVFASFLRALVHVINNELPRRQADAVVLLERLVAAVISEARLGRTPANADLLSAVADEIAAVPGRPVNFPGIAAGLGMSYSHFRRRFRQETGYAPQEFLDQSRLRDAANLLRSTSLRIQEVADRVAWNDPAGFSRSFRRHFGMSPRAYRDAVSLD